MTERLDQIEALLLATAERLSQTNETLSQTNAGSSQTRAILDQVAIQQQQNTVDIDNLLGAISTTDVEVRSLRESIVGLRESVAENGQRFNILIQEMRSDRRANQQAFQSLLLH